MLLERRQALAGLIAAGLPLPLEAAPVAEAKTYSAVALQLAARSVEGAADRAAARAQMLAHIAEVGKKLFSARIFIEQYGGSPLRLAVLPEYLLTSYPGRISIPDFAAKAALEPDGPEYEALGKIAQDIRHTYTIGYASTNSARDGSFRSVRVVVTAPPGRPLVVRSRTGYRAGTSTR